MSPSSEVGGSEKPSSGKTNSPSNRATEGISTSQPPARHVRFNNNVEIAHASGEIWVKEFVNLEEPYVKSSKKLKRSISAYEIEAELPARYKGKRKGRWSRERERAETAASSPSQIMNHFLYAHGDTPQSLDSTKRILDELITDFITEICFEAHRGAQLAGRQKIKLDDIKFACRKNPTYLGKIEEMSSKKSEIDKARKLVDGTDDKITKSNLKALEEPLGDDDDADDHLDTKTLGGRSTGK